MSDIMNDYADVCNERDKLKAKLDLIKRNMKKTWPECEIIDEVIGERDRWKAIAGKIADYVAHEQFCIRTLWEAGEPTDDGGYRIMYAGKWYQSRPVDETPKCQCGADEALAAYAKALEGK